MVPGQPASRLRMITVALRLVTISVVFGLAAGTVSVVTGLRGHSLGVVAVGLGVLADVTGSAVLIWRFRAERDQPGMASALEIRAAAIVAVALGAVSVVLTIESVSALVHGSRPGTSPDNADRRLRFHGHPRTLGLCQAAPGKPDGKPRAAGRRHSQWHRRSHQLPGARGAGLVACARLVAGRPGRRTDRRGGRGVGGVAHLAPWRSPPVTPGPRRGDERASVTPVRPRAR